MNEKDIVIAAQESINSIASEALDTKDNMLSEVDPNPDSNRKPNQFERPIEGFDFSRHEIEDYIRRHLTDAMQEMGLGLRDIAVRGGDEDGRKFLEAVFEYDDVGRSIYEDEVVQYLDKYHPMAIEGVRVSFRPLNDKQSGNLEDYWATFNARQAEIEKLSEQEKGEQAKEKALHNDDVPEPPPPRMEDPNDTHNLDYQSKIDVDIYQDSANREEAQRYDESKGVPFSRDEISQLAAALGTTNDLKKGGWILPDGRLLNFIKDGVRRKEQDIGIGFTEARKHRIAKEVKKMRENVDPTERKEETTGPYDINGYVMSQPVDPWGTLAEKTYPETFPLEAIKGGLIRYAISKDGDAVEIDAYGMPTQGQFDVLEDIHEWIKFVNEGGYSDNGAKSPEVRENKELTYTEQEEQSNQPTANDAMIDEDNFEKHRRERQEHASEEIDVRNRRFNGENAKIDPADVPSSKMIIVYVGIQPDAWWDYATPEEVQQNLVKDLRTYFRDGKKPNEDFNLPDEYEDDGLDAQGEKAVANDEAVGWLKERNADLMPKRNYRPRSTLLQQIDYDTARRIIRENVSLIRTIPMLDVLKAEQKILAYFRLKLTRDQLARYFFKIGDGAITKAWAEVIADDQINKASERLRIAKWKKNGVRMVRWIHSNYDEPRPYHREKWNGRSGIFDGFPNGLNGFIFPIDYPPIIDPLTGERGYPGQLINCKCHLEPVR